MAELNTSGARFEVALSFAGERRPFVQEVADYLSQKIGQEKVFYDKYHEADLARINLDIYLQDVYHNQSKLIVLFICADYEKKEWCGLEWRALRDLIKKRHGSSIIPIRFDKTELEGIYSIDGYLSAETKNPREIAELILKRCSGPSANLGSPCLPQTLPYPLRVEIYRDALIEGIRHSVSENEITVVSGPSGIGKTSMLAQFYRKNSERSIAVFLKASSPSSYDFQLVIDEITEQAVSIANRLGGGSSQKSVKDSDGTMQNALGILRRAASSKSTTIMLIVDGLDDIPDAEESAARAIFNRIPLGFPQIRVIASGKRVLNYVRERNKNDFGEFQVVGFFEHETKAYLKDLYSADEDLIRLHKIGKGVPGYYASLRRVIGSQGELTNDLPSTLEKMHDVEWKQLEGDSMAEQIVAILCFDKRTHNLETLAGLLKVDQIKIEGIAIGLSMLEVDGKTVRFSSDIFRQIGENRLKHLKKVTLNRLIEYFSADVGSEESATHLPDLFNRAERYDDLVNYLDDTFIAHALSRTNAAQFLQSRSSLALAAATDRKRGEDALRFGLHRANLNHLYFDENWAARLDAFLSIGDMKAALKSARALVTVEDRVQSLCAIARHQRLSSGAADTDLVVEVTQEYHQLNKEQLGTRAHEIAADLVLILPKLAIELIQIATEKEKPNNKTDWAMARFSLSAQLIKSSENKTGDAVDKLRRQITDPELRGFAHATKIFAKDQTVEEIVSEVTKMEADPEKVHFLRVWAAENPKNPHRGKVIRFAIETALRSIKSHPSPSFFLEVVRNARGTAECRELVSMVDAQLARLETIGPTLDCKRLQLTLCELECDYAPDECDKRFQTIISSTLSLQDLSTKAAAISNIIATSIRVKASSPDSKFPNRNDRLQIELEECVDVILLKTADHYQVLKACLKNLAPVDFNLACRFAEKINTETRRDEAFSDILFLSVARRVKGCDIELLTPWLDRIISKNVRKDTVARILRYLAFNISSKVKLFNLRTFEQWLDRVENTAERAVGVAMMTLVYKSYPLTNDDSQIISDLKIRVDKLFKGLHDPIEQIGALYTLTYIFSNTDRKRAKSYLANAERTRSNLIVRTPNSQHCLFLNLKLTLRAFSGLVPKRIFTELEYKEIISIAENLPGFSARIEIIAELSIRFHLGGCIDECSIVVREHLQPILDRTAIDSASHEEYLFIAAPALYCANQLGCLTALERVSEATRENAITRILEFLLTRLVPGEPYQDTSEFYNKLDASRIYEILKLARELKIDSNISHFIDHIVEFFKSSSFAHRVTAGDRVEIARKIDEIVEEKFPNPRFIKHEGYTILGKAAAHSIRGDKAPLWTPIIESARKIPNLSDRVYVVANLAALIDKRSYGECQKLLEEAIESAAKIPVAYDRHDRLLMIADVAKPIDKRLFKLAVGAILGSTEAINDDDRIEELRKRAIDLAYQHDPKYAEELVSKLDASIDREKGTRLGKQLARLKWADAYPKHELDSKDSIEDGQIERACWRSLKRLNSGSIAPTPLKSLASSLRTLDQKNIREGYAIVCYSVESSVVAYKKTDEAFTILKRVYKTCLSSTRLVLDYIIKIKSESYIDVDEVGSELNDGNCVVRKGEATTAFSMMNTWLGRGNTDDIFIVSPTLDQQDLELVAAVQASNPRAQIYVVMGRRNEKIEDQHSIKSGLRKKWAELASNATQKAIQVCILGEVPSGELPDVINKRFIACNQRGFTTSDAFHSIYEKEISLSLIDSKEVENLVAAATIFSKEMPTAWQDSTYDYEHFRL